MKKVILFFALALSLCVTPALALDTSGLSQSGRVVSHALNQMGYTEGVGEYTIFGESYGYPHGYWCDMFVSWCADQAGVSKAAYPRSISCTQHCRMFTAMGRYQSSAARGGTYIPLQGDLVLFQKPDTGTIHHVGLVLYVEDGKVFAIEGNALTVRWDYPSDVVSEARIHDLEPLDYVTCNVYPLTDPRLHGYAVPAYTSRDPLTLNGFVDLGIYSGAREQIEAVAASGLMPGTSSHTFSPRAGLARGEFLQMVLDLYGFAGWRDGTPAFDDVPPEHPYYSSVMTARSAGLIPETEENLFYPDQWISGEDAQFILSALLARLGVEDRTFRFTPGDLSPILTPYTTRGDIAQALYILCRDAAPLTTEVFDGLLTLRGESLDWPIRTLDGVCYTPLPFLQRHFPELIASGLPVPDAPFKAETPSEPDISGEAAMPLGYETPEGVKALRQALTLEVNGTPLQTQGFLWNGTLYVSVGDVARLLQVPLKAVPSEQK